MTAGESFVKKYQKTPDLKALQEAGASDLGGGVWAFPDGSRVRAIWSHGLNSESGYTYTVLPSEVDDWAKQQAERLRANDAERDVARQENAWRGQVVADGSEELWESLAAKITVKVEQFAKDYQPGRYLRADRRNSNNLTVETTVQPLIRIEVIRTPGSHVQADISRLPNALGPGTQSQTRKFYFTENDGLVCFSDGTGAYTAEELANAICQKAVDFFDDLA